MIEEKEETMEAGVRVTQRLYYDDSYLKNFSATIEEVRMEDGHALVRLDRSAFYPTSGGQPYDTGMIGDARVVDVRVDQAGEVWHAVEGPAEAGATVACAIDWARRFDHMQQHAGEHMLAGAIWTRLRGVTIGLHLGAEFSTIDVALPDGAMRVEPEVLRALEDDVNAEIQRDVPVRCWFPTQQEMERLPLRKPPTVKEHIRVVMIGEHECVACGGTHPSTAGQIGLVKILDARPSKGKMRVSFLCGMRALRDYQMRMRISDAASAQLSTGVEGLPQAVEHALEREKQARQALEREKRAQALRGVDALLAGAVLLQGGWKAVTASVQDLDAQALRELAGALTAHEKVYALLESRCGEHCLLAFARSTGAGAAMGPLLNEAARTYGGKGGGRPEFAQGSAARPGAAEYARRKLQE